MAKFERIQDLELLEKFSEATERHIDVLFPIEYLQRSHVYVSFEGNSKLMQGGFVIVPEPPFRVIESLPDGVCDSHPFFGEVDPADVCELTALWLSPAARDKGLSFWLWTRSYFEMLRTGKTYFVYAYAARKTHLKRIFSSGSPQVLFRGETKLLPGMKTCEEESVEAINIWKMAYVPLTKPFFFLGRLRVGGLISSPDTKTLSS